MFAVTALLVLVLFALAAVSPQTFVYFCLWVLTIPYWWNFDVQITFSTPLGPMNLIAMQLFGFLGACFAIVVRQIDRVFEEIKLCLLYTSDVYKRQVQSVQGPPATESAAGKPGRIVALV